ncbi:hypothetical protein GX51_02361 [Blastomyces parvus]|uniref:Uncharacterized protein n=1 Tax=Blastomyces parvus TaxID=2060905 RepID=A0A2B7XBQ2_9EURO|nr:hypothetical protein GX51_02361 [Blastomyces parvus]
MATRSGPMPVPIATGSVCPVLAGNAKTKHTVDVNESVAGKFAFDEGVEVDEGRDRYLAESGKEEDDGDEEEEEGDEGFISDLVVKFDTSRARDGEVRCRAGSMGEAPNVTGATVEAVVREPGNGRGSGVAVICEWESKIETGRETKTYLMQNGARENEQVVYD